MNQNIAKQFQPGPNAGASAWARYNGMQHDLQRANGYTGAFRPGGQGVSAPQQAQAAPTPFENGQTVQAPTYGPMAQQTPNGGNPEALAILQQNQQQPSAPLPAQTTAPLVQQPRQPSYNMATGQAQGAMVNYNPYAPANVSAQNQGTYIPNGNVVQYQGQPQPLQQGYQRVSPGVYRGPNGQMVNSVNQPGLMAPLPSQGYYRRG